MLGRGGTMANRLLFGFLVLGMTACATARTRDQVFGANEVLRPVLTAGKDGTRLRVARPAYAQILAELGGDFRVLYASSNVLEPGSHALNVPMLSAVGRSPCYTGQVDLNTVADQVYQEGLGRRRRMYVRGSARVSYLESLATPAGFRAPRPVVTVVSERPIAADLIETVFESLDVPELLEPEGRAALVAAALVRAQGEETTAALVSVSPVWICR